MLTTGLFQPTVCSYTIRRIRSSTIGYHRNSWALLFHGGAKYPSWHDVPYYNDSYSRLKQESRAIVGRTARCCCKFQYAGLSKFTAASRGFHCDR